MSLNLWGSLPAYLKKACLPPNKIFWYCIDEHNRNNLSNVVKYSNIAAFNIFSVPKIHIRNELTIQYELKSKRGLGELVLHRITGC